MCKQWLHLHNSEKPKKERKKIGLTFITHTYGIWSSFLDHRFHSVAVFQSLCCVVCVSIRLKNHKCQQKKETNKFTTNVNTDSITQWFHWREGKKIRNNSIADICCVSLFICQSESDLNNCQSHSAAYVWDSYK